MKAFVLTVILCLPVLFQFRHQIFPSTASRGELATPQLAARTRWEHAELIRLADRIQSGPYAPGDLDKAMKLREQVKADYAELRLRGVDVGPIDSGATRDAGHAN